MRAADVLDHIVVNLIEVESLPAPPEWQEWGLCQGELIDCPYDPDALADVAIGWLYVAGEFRPPGGEAPA